MSIIGLVVVRVDCGVGAGIEEQVLGHSGRLDSFIFLLYPSAGLGVFYKQFPITHPSITHTLSRIAPASKPALRLHRPINLFAQSCLHLLNPGQPPPSDLRCPRHSPAYPQQQRHAGKHPQVSHPACEFPHSPATAGPTDDHCGDGEEEEQKEITNLDVAAEEQEAGEVEETAAFVVAEGGAGGELTQEHVHAWVQQVGYGWVAEGVLRAADYGQAFQQVAHAQDFDQGLLGEGAGQQCQQDQDYPHRLLIQYQFYKQPLLKPYNKYNHSAFPSLPLLPLLSTLCTISPISATSPASISPIHSPFLFTIYLTLCCRSPRGQFNSHKVRAARRVQCGGIDGSRERICVTRRGWQGGREGIRERRRRNRGRAGMEEREDREQRSQGVTVVECRAWRREYSGCQVGASPSSVSLNKQKILLSWTRLSQYPLASPTSPICSILATTRLMHPTSSLPATSTASTRTHSMPTSPFSCSNLPTNPSKSYTTIILMTRLLAQTATRLSISSPSTKPKKN